MADPVAGERRHQLAVAVVHGGGLGQRRRGDVSRHRDRLVGVQECPDDEQDQRAGSRRRASRRLSSRSSGATSRRTGTTRRGSGDGAFRPARHPGRRRARPGRGRRRGDRGPGPAARAGSGGSPWVRGGDPRPPRASQSSAPPARPAPRAPLMPSRSRRSSSDLPTAALGPGAAALARGRRERRGRRDSGNRGAPVPRVLLPVGAAPAGGPAGCHRCRAAESRAADSRPLSAAAGAGRRRLSAAPRGHGRRRPGRRDAPRHGCRRNRGLRRRRRHGRPRSGWLPRSQRCRSQHSGTWSGPGPSGTGRARLDYSRVLARRGYSTGQAVSCERLTRRTTRYLAVPIHPGIYGDSPSPSQVTVVGKRRNCATATRRLGLADSSGWAARLSRARRTTRGGSTHNSGRPRRRRP